MEVHLHRVKGVCPKMMGQYFSHAARVPRATFFDSVREAAMEAIRQIGEILEARLRHTQEYLRAGTCRDDGDEVSVGHKDETKGY